MQTTTLLLNSHLIIVANTLQCFTANNRKYQLSFQTEIWLVLILNLTEFFSSLQDSLQFNLCRAITSSNAVFLNSFIRAILTLRILKNIKIAVFFHVMLH